MSIKKIHIISIALSITLLISLLAGCNGNSNDNQDTQSTPATGDPSQTQQTQTPNGSEEFELDPYYLSNRGELGDGSFVKMNLWVQEDGVESEGWMSIEVGIDGEKISFSIDGVLGDQDLAFEYEDEGNKAFWDENVRYFLQDLLIREGHPAGEIFYKHLYIPLEEYFLVVETIGGTHTAFLPAGYEHSIPGYDTYTMGEGLTFLRKYQDIVLFEVCISPDYPLPLYVYAAEDWFTDYDPDAMKFSVELVEYSS